MYRAKLFIDGSVDVQCKIGFGAFLIIEKDEPVNISLKRRVKTRMFENTSSTKLELQTLLWALQEININYLTVYTDSQNLLTLLNRRKRLETSNFISNNNRTLQNAELYRKFYNKMDEINCEFVKVKGHKAKHEKDEIDKIFTVVDRAARNVLRCEKKII